MQVLIVTFKLAGITPEEYAARCDEIAPVFAAIPGLVSKTWLADPATNTYGGVYEFTDRAAVDAYFGGDVFAMAKANPGFADLQVHVFGTFAAPGRVTRAERKMAA
ncbi:MAG: YdhR family protein [Dehalococcoidia bacterium]|nr:YdhR family protein [Dehalococcoidia bacterium]